MLNVSSKSHLKVKSMEKTKESRKRALLSEVTSSNYIDGIFHFLNNPHYSITTCYSESEDSDEEECVGNLALINGGIFAIVKTPKENPLIYLGDIDFTNITPYETLHDNLCSIYTLIEELEDQKQLEIIAADQLLACKEHPQTLENTLTSFLDHFKKYSDYFLELSKDAPPGKHEFSDKELESTFISFVSFIEKKVFPKLDF